MELIINSFKLRFLIGSILIMAGFAVLPLMLTTLRMDNVNFLQAEDSVSTTSTASYKYDNPNVVANGITGMAEKSGQAISVAEHNLMSGLKTIATTLTRRSKSLALATVNSGKSVLHDINKGFAIYIYGVSSVITFTVNAPGKVIGSVANMPSFISVIRPADNSQLPVIDSQLANLYAAQSARPNIPSSIPSSNISTPQIDLEAAWPLHGEVTTQFGVPHRPYQVTHTGLDISSGNRSGITEIKPFKPGSVIDVVRSKYGLGNHLVVDHGGGMTSVYGHLHTIIVQAGQQVDKNTVLGYEGSTGVSTGPHLHFEVRLNGQPADPRQFINGQP